MRCHALIVGSHEESRGPTVALSAMPKPKFLELTIQEFDTKTPLHQPWLTERIHW